MTRDLPYIDEHSIEVDADRETVWKALTAKFGESGGAVFAGYARLIGVSPLSSQGALDEVGSTRIGFLVSEVESPRHLELTGAHRFSTYSLTWDVAEVSAGRSRLSATTRAAFPGLHGRAYKAAVIDSGAHARITRRMLNSIGRQATRG